MAVSELSSRIRNGEPDAIMEGFRSDAGLYKAQAIISVVNNRLFSDAIRKQLIALTDNNLRIMGYTLSDFAVAALDKLGIMHYNGDKSEIVGLISADQWFA